MNRMARLAHGGDGRMDGQKALKTEILNVPMVDTEPNSDMPIRHVGNQEIQSIDRGSKDWPLTSDDVVIAIMGVTGSGKSTFISLLTDGSAPVGQSLEACTSEVGIYSYLHHGKKRIYLIDTPGFDDTFRSDTEVLKEIAFFLATLYKQGVKLAGLLYLHRIIDRRMQGSALRSIHMLKALCGEGSFPNVVLVTTMWNVLEQSGVASNSGVQRENELRGNDNFWGRMEKGGSRIVRHSGDLQSARDIVSLLVDKKSTVVLDIQRQMVDEEKSLDETTAGNYVQKELLDARKRHERDIADYQQTMDDALREKDNSMAAILQNQKEENEAKVSGIIASERGLKVNLSELAKEKDGQYSARQSDLEKKLSSEIAHYEDHLRRLQDEFDRKVLEHKREMAQLRNEARAKSAEEFARLDELMMAKEKQCLAQQLEDQEQIRAERANWQARESELLEEKKQAEYSGSAAFFRYILSSIGSATSSAFIPERRGPRDSRDKGRGARSGGGDAHDRDRYKRDPSVRYQGGTDPYDYNPSGRGTRNKSHFGDY